MKTLLAFLSGRKDESKTRVCFITNEYPPDRGGISKSANRISNFLADAGFEVHVFTKARDTDKSELTVPFKEKNILVYRVPSLKTNFSDECRRLINVVDEVLPFHIFHGFSLHMAFPCLPCLTRKTRPLIVSVRGVEIERLTRNARLLRITKEILQAATWITSVSTDSLRVLNFIENIRDKSSFISNSVNVEQFPQWKQTSLNQGVVGTVATFRQKKNIPLLINAYNNVASRLRRKLLLVGDFHERYQKTAHCIRETIERCNLSDQVEITGYVNNADVSNYITSMNVFVVSSDHEGLPNTLLEAASTGIPIVSTAIDGVKDLFENNVNALLVPPGDVKKMSFAIESILTDEGLCRKLSEGALELARQNDLSSEKKKWIALYQKVRSCFQDQ